MKKQVYVLALFALLIFSMCQNPKTAEKTIKVQDKKESCSSPLTATDSAKYVNHRIEIKGEIETPLQLTVDSLKKFPIKTITDFKIVCQSGETKKIDKNAKGVLLKDILEKAKIKQNGHKDRNFYIVASASDDYKATFSWAELFNNPTGENVYVLFEENGKPIKNGEMILICKNDIKTGPRHVYWLKSIEVYKVK
ncbi:molybdopterin-dependent oxidoreductase [Flavobacterium sp. 5]|uniref:molybdopterin-dependent oxidoreductase n=1 Tax=Flavobacterium sp. 5 TaxID=2035199 RepID=UPI000C2C2F99|nr:molybdopterin-dependent oxidoreductase [Flavobacterium sp. 5]PKB16345.1 molybdopterin-dependent oxidoreductase-like protein [Flavobacterium sp. 5]